MKQRVKSYIVFLAIFAIYVVAFSEKNIARAATVVQQDLVDLNAAEQVLDMAERENIGDDIGIGIILTEDYMQKSYTSKKIDENGSVIGDGVRLRKRPNKEATVLELMYNKETVCINYTKSRDTDGKWLYIKRVRTGTWGWVKQNYILPWD